VIEYINHANHAPEHTTESDATNDGAGKARFVFLDWGYNDA
jgi:hypothetical protein